MAHHMAKKWVNHLEPCTGKYQSIFTAGMTGFQSATTGKPFKAMRGWQVAAALNCTKLHVTPGMSIYRPVCDFYRLSCHGWSETAAKQSADFCQCTALIIYENQATVYKLTLTFVMKTKDIIKRRSAGMKKNIYTNFYCCTICAGLAYQNNRKFPGGPAYPGTVGTQGLGGSVINTRSKRSRV